MKKKFNVTGTCIPEKHYMVDTNKKLEKIIEIIDQGEYFTINRARQYGKTTTMFLLYKQFKNSNDFLPIKISFEGIGDLVFTDEEMFSKTFIEMLVDVLSFQNENLAHFLDQQKNNVTKFKELSKVITNFIKETNKKVILMIDEVDKSSNNQLFLSFLGMLRNKYLLRNEGMDYTFHSVILAGVHDIKTLKVQLRPDEEKKYNSPWNIATDFEVDMSFSAEEIKTMLDDYVENKKVELDKVYFSERLYYYTSGYPFLVSKLCKIIDEKLMPEDELVWKNEYMDIAVKRLIRESNTNFDSLIKNIENNKNLAKLIDNLLMKGKSLDFNIHNPDIALGNLYSIFKNKNGKLKIHNRVYEQLIYDYMSSKMQTSGEFDYTIPDNYLNEDGSLNIEKILIKFQQFMKHEYSKNRQAFLEHDARLVFLAFISPIINGVGFAFKEVTGGEERRFDIVITYEKRMYILELKIWRGEEAHKKGLNQLSEYLDQYGLDEGYLLVFDFRKEENRDKASEKIESDGKKIFSVWC